MILTLIVIAIFIALSGMVTCAWILGAMFMFFMFLKAAVFANERQRKLMICLHIVFQICLCAMWGIFMWQTWAPLL